MSAPRNPQQAFSLISALKFFLVGIAATGILVSLKVLIEMTSLGHWVDVSAYQVLHKTLPSFTPEVETPVVVLDISKVPRNQDDVTSRETLRPIVEELINQGSRAIAIDVDFSPNETGWRDAQDPEFFDFCLKKSKDSSHPVPILLGIYRTSAKASNAWLGDPEYKSLAVDITIDTRDTTQMRSWIQKTGQDILPSIVGGLIQSQDISSPKPPRWFEFGLEDLIRVRDDTEYDIRIAEYRVNYSKLELIETQAIATISPQSIKESGEKFRNKLVILGDGTRGRSTDSFQIPGKTGTVPGVYLHASGLYTLTVEPFYELKEYARIVVDVVLAFGILICVFVAKPSTRIGNTHESAWLLRIVIACAVCVGGGLAVKYLDILWLDFVFVALAVLLHPAFETVVSNVTRKVVRFANAG